MGYPITQTTAVRPLFFFMGSTADPLAGVTGLTGGSAPAVKITKLGGSAVTPSGAISEVDATNHPGWYKVAADAGDSDTLGPLLLSATGTGAKPWHDVFEVVAYNPSDAAAAGLTRLDAAVTTRLAPTTAGRTLDVTAGGEAGIDLANVGSPTTTVNLSGLTIKTATDVETKLDTLLTRLSSARAGYLDNLSAGAVATVQDINNLNQSASRRVLLTTVGQMERPESGSTTYQVEARTYTGDGALVNADTTPTLTATGLTTGSLAANLSAATNPSTGVYRWTYTASSAATLEQVRFDLSCAISSDTQTMSVHSQVCDFVAATFTTTDRATLNAAATAAALSSGLGTVNTTLTAISSYIDTEVAAILAAVDTEVASIVSLATGIKAKTDLLPGDPGDESNIQASIAAVAATLVTLTASVNKIKWVVANVRSVTDGVLTGFDDNGTTPKIDLEMGTTPGEITASTLR